MAFLGCFCLSLRCFVATHDSLSDMVWIYCPSGYLCGLKSEARVPVILGLEDRAVSMDELKAFSGTDRSDPSLPDPFY